MLRPQIVFLTLFFWLTQGALAQPPTPVTTSTPQVKSSPQSSATPRGEELATPQESSSKVSPVDSIVQVPADFQTAQASISAFMDLMEAAGPLRPDLYLHSQSHLDLSELPRVVREEQGVTLCQQLFAILNTADVELENIDDRAVGDTALVYRQPSGDEISLRRQEDGRWLVSKESVKVIPRMHRVLTNKGKIASWGLEALNFDVLGLNANLWLGLLLLPVFSYLCGSFVVMILRSSVGKLFGDHLGMDVVLQKQALKPLGWLFASLVMWVGLSVLDIPTKLLFWLAVGVKILATVAAIVSAFRLSDAASLYLAQLSTKTSTKIDDMLIPLARRTFKAVVCILALLFLAQNLDIEVWSLFAGFSIFGAMVALAGQDLVKNFFGSVTVLLDQPFAVGDWVVVEGVEGTVEDVGFRSTRIRTFYDSLITLPNSRLITASVDNYGARNFRRYSKKIAVKRSTSPEKLETFCEGIRELVRQHPYTRKDSYQIWVNDITDYAFDILVYVFWATPDWNTELREKHRFLIDIHRLATTLEVEFAYPSQRIFVTRNEDSAESEFDLDIQEQALSQGRGAAGQMLESSLPKEIPPPMVIEFNETMTPKA